MSMTPFRLWPEGTPFELIAKGGTTRYGVKLRSLDYEEVDPETGEKVHKTANAFFFDTNTLERVSHKKNVSDVRSVSGRLARTQDNALIIVNKAKKGLWIGYSVNLAGYQILTDSEIDLIPVEVGERRDEVDIILREILKAHTKSQKLLETLELVLFE